MIKSKIRMAGSKKAEIYLYDEIGEYWGVGISAKMVADELKAFGKLDVINLRVNSPGGDVFDATAMYNILVRNPARVEVDIEGMALSAATIVIMAGDVIRMAANSYMMIHDPYSFAGGTAEDFRKVAESLELVKTNIVNTYSARTRNKPEQLRKWMADETWMSASEAKDMGFADEVSNALDIAARFDVTRYRNAPQQAIDRAKMRDDCTSDQMRSKLRAMSQRAEEVCKSTEANR